MFTLNDRRERELFERQAFLALSENKKQQFCNLQNFVDKQKLFYAENRVYGPEFNVWAMLTAKM